jgi:uncharacterized SAM-binding protein YcdF (DUF218 family)
MNPELTWLIKDWLLPPGSLVLLLLLGVLLWQRLFGRLLVLLSAVALYLLSVPQTNAWLAAGLETDPSNDANAIRAADARAILVFLAGRSWRAPELNGADGLSPLSLQRLHHAVYLHRQTGLPLALSGGATRDGRDEGLALLAARELEDVYGVRPLIVEATSRNTRENAIQSAGLLARADIKRVALVTSAWHMPRARYSAEMAGLEVIPAGTGFQSSAADGPAQLSDWTPSAKALAVNRNLLHEHLGLAWYRYGPASP